MQGGEGFGLQREVQRDHSCGVLGWGRWEMVVRSRRVWRVWKEDAARVDVIFPSELPSAQL